MNVFGTDASERTTVPIGLALVSIGGAWLLSVILAAFGIQVPWYLDAPSPFALFGLLFVMFDRSLWRQGWVRHAGIVRVPDLNGEWRGTLTSSFDSIPRDVRMTIHQTWRTILVTLAADGSGSRSTVAAIFVGSPDGAVLTYQYRNDPRPNSPSSMNIHDGTATLRLNGDRLEGDYYTGRGRQNFGSILVRRQT